MPETGTTATTYAPGFTALLDQMFPGLAGQFQGMLGAGADTGQLEGVGQSFMDFVTQLQGGPNATQQGGLNTLQGAQDLTNLQNAYQNYYGAIAAPTIQNNAIAGGLGQGAATEAQGLAGAQAGTALAGIQNQAQQNYGQAQLGVGGGLTNAILQALQGAGGAYGNAASIQQQGHGQNLAGLTGFLSSILGYRPPQTGTSSTAPFWPTNFQGVLNGIQTGSNLFQPPTSTTPGGSLYGPATSAWNWLTGPGAGPGASPDMSSILTSGDAF
jgi:hypothetical protein